MTTKNIDVDYWSKGGGTCIISPVKKIWSLFTVRMLFISFPNNSLEIKRVIICVGSSPSVKYSLPIYMIP